jgi:hypothetical protein
MSRSGYNDDGDQWDLIRWRGQVTSAIRGRRGQVLLRDLLTALDAMPTKELIADELETCDGVCALGAVGRARGVDMARLDPQDANQIGEAFGIARSLAAEIVWVNDEASTVWRETPAQRWSRVRDWVAAQIKSGAPSP